MELGEGQSVTTLNGKVEILLTPGVFLRLGPNSSAKLIAAGLTDTQVQLDQGRAMIEVDQIFPENHLRVMQGSFAIEIQKKGLYDFDAARHQVRVFEIHRTYPNNAPLINGTKIVESWTRGIGDRTDGIGPIIQYNVYVMENGDKVFARMDGIIENGSEKGTATVLGRITSGTGKFAAIQGVVREVAKFEIKSGFNENQTNIEYSIGK